MVAGQLTAFFRLLVGTRKIDGSDRQLLERFVADADEVAFAALVDRHGQLVFGICRSVLRHEQDAEDAFQATFLVLARLAPSIRKRDSLASWLHGVALRTALKARKAMATRRRTEERASVPSQQEPVSEAALQEVQTILHEEIERLPDKYRAPLVLCFLEGKNRVEAAQQLGWKEGTVSGRIAQARALLEKRLARRGVALPVALAAAALLPVPAKAVVPIVVQAALDFAAHRVSETLSPIAATLAQGVIQAMFVAKLKTIATAALMLAVALAGGGWLAYAALQPEGHNPANGAPPSGLGAKAPHQPKPPANAPAPPQSDQPPEGEPALPPLAVKRLGSLKWQFPSAVMDLAYSADGKWLVTNDGDQIRVHDSATGTEIRSFRAQLGRFASFFIASDGKVAVSKIYAKSSVEILDGKIQILDGATGQQVHSYPGYFAYIDGNLCGSADGRILAGVGFLGDVKERPSGDWKPYARVWNSATGKPLAPFASGIKGAYGVALSPDGKTLAWRTVGGTVLVVNTADGKVRFKMDAFLTGFQGEDTPPSSTRPRIDRALAFSPDGQVLAFGSREGLTLVNAADGKEARVCPRLEPTKIGENLLKIAFTAAGDTVVALCDDSTIGVWDVHTGKEKSRFRPPDRRSVSQGRRFAISPDGKTIAAIIDQNKIAFFDTATGKMHVEPGSKFIHGPVLSPDGKTVAGSSDLWSSLRQDICLWDRATGQIRHTINFKPGATPFQWAFSPDSKTLLGLGRRRPLFWDVQTGKETIRELPETLETEGTGYSLAISADGKTIATDVGGTVCLWDLPSGKLSRIQVSGKGLVFSVALSADGKRLAAVEGGDNGRSVCVWDLTAKKELCRIPTQGYVTGVAGSPDGKLVTCRINIDDVGWLPVWDADTGKELHRRGPFRAVSALAFAPDGKTLALAMASSWSGELRPHINIQMFDTRTMQPVRVMEGGHLLWVDSLSFSADSRFLVSGSNDGTALIWDLSKTERRDP